MELARVRAIEGVWFVHFCAYRGHVVVRLAGFIQVMDSLGKCKDQIDVIVKDVRVLLVLQLLLPS